MSHGSRQRSAARLFRRAKKFSVKAGELRPCADFGPKIDYMLFKLNREEGKKSDFSTTDLIKQITDGD